jgi:hypothetical protein
MRSLHLNRQTRSAGAWERLRSHERTNAWFEHTPKPIGRVRGGADVPGPVSAMRIAHPFGEQQLDRLSDQLLEYPKRCSVWAFASTMRPDDR